MIIYIKRLCAAMMLVLTTLSIAVAVELMLMYFQSGMLVYMASALAAAIASIWLCCEVVAMVIDTVTDIVMERVMKNCGKIAENKLEIR